MRKSIIGILLMFAILVTLVSCTKVQPYNLTPDITPDPIEEVIKNLGAEKTPKGIIITYTFSDEEMKQIQWDDLPYEETIPEMVGIENIEILKNATDHLIVLLKNNDKVFMAYDIFTKTIPTEYLTLD